MSVFQDRTTCVTLMKSVKLRDDYETASNSAMASDYDSVSDVSSETLNYSIGELSREFGVSLRTLRFYEDRGLLSPKRAGTTRLYSAQDRHRLSIILKGKHLGFTLTEIRALLAKDMKEGLKGTGVEGLKLSLEQVDEQIAHMQAQQIEVAKALEELQAYRFQLVSKG